MLKILTNQKDKVNKIHFYFYYFVVIRKSFIISDCIERQLRAADAVVPAATKNINVKDCHINKYGRIFNNAIGILLTHAIDCELSDNIPVTDSATMYGPHNRKRLV